MHKPHGRGWVDGSCLKGKTFQMAKHRVSRVNMCSYGAKHGTSNSHGSSSLLCTSQLSCFLNPPPIPSSFSSLGIKILS